MDYPFKPHIIAVRVCIDKEVEVDRHRVLDVPLEILSTHGPRNFGDGWAKHWRLAEAVETNIEAPWNAEASQEATKLYSKFAWAAESFLLATSPEATSRHFGRGSSITFKEVEVSLSNKGEHIYATPLPSSWEKLGNCLRLLKSLRKNGSREDLAEETIGRLGAMAPRGP